MKSLKGGSVSCKCEGNPDPYFKPNCDACKEGCGGPYILSVLAKHQTRAITSRICDRTNKILKT